MLRVSDHFERSDTGRQRKANEDSAFVRPPLFVVADGMGGARAGEVASQTAIEAFHDGLPDGPASAEERLAELVEEANRRVHELATSNEDLSGMGTTLTAAYLTEADLSVAHVGDSRLYCLRDGEIEQLTRDHSLVDELVRSGQLTPEEAEEHPQRSIITRALGPEQQIVVDHHTWPARDGDIFLVCSDGLTSMLPDAQVAEIVKEAESLREAGVRLVEAANQAGGRDNITVLLFRVEDVGSPAEPPTGEQATGVGEAALRTEDVRKAVETAPPAQDGPRTGAPARVSPRAPRPPREAASGPARRRWAGPAKVLAVVAVVTFIFASAAWIASRSVYFVGTSDEGFVTLYRGLPYELPAGLELFQKQFESGVPASGLPPRVTKTVTDHKLRKESDAVDLIRQLERGELAGQ
jgi:protein phosphatase